MQRHITASGLVAGLVALVGVMLSTAAAAADNNATAGGDLDYQRARYHEIHFPPAIDQASNEDCLACHSEILERPVRPYTQAGLQADSVLAWYQTLDTYEGQQETFHARHLTTPFAQKVMDLKCTFCHQGNDPREEAPVPPNSAEDRFTLRKMVNVEQTCLRCHGAFPSEYMEGVEGSWEEAREIYEVPDDPFMQNGCLGACHAETYRTVRHQVTYLKPEAIEELAQDGSSDVCYGCHGGRAWYRISYPYPRHPWPGMEDVVDGTPDWAVDRPTQSEAHYRLKTGTDQ